MCAWFVEKVSISRLNMQNYDQKDKNITMQVNVKDSFPKRVIQTRKERVNWIFNFLNQVLISVHLYNDLILIMNTILKKWTGILILK